MNKKTSLQLQAIQAAKQQNWQLAVDLNQSILEIDNKDVNAYNRLGVAFLQSNQKKQAADSFKKALEVDKSNNLAKKHLSNLTKKRNVKLPSFFADTFIEEPGKTKTVELHRLASKNVLSQLQIGSECQLKPKSRYISIEWQDQYIGALPEDLSFRLTKLIRKGNKYSCRVQSVSPCSCSIFLKEIKRSQKNEHVNSFPSVKTKMTTIDDIDDMFIEDDVPVQIVDTDNDNEKNPASLVKEKLKDEK